MPFDGNGNWTSDYYPQSGELIKASDFNNVFIADMANGFGNCVTRDGQGIMQTNFNANSYRVINVADPESDKDAVNLETLNDKETTIGTTIDTKISTMLDSLYPIGSIYIGTQATCPLALLIEGSTWVKIEGRYLLTSGTLTGTSEAYDATDEVAAGSPNITSTPNWWCYGVSKNAAASGALVENTPTIGDPTSEAATRSPTGQLASVRALSIDASKSNAVYGSSTTVRPPAYVVNVWKRVETPVSS